MEGFEHWDKYREPKDPSIVKEIYRLVRQYPVTMLTVQEPGEAARKRRWAENIKFNAPSTRPQ